MTLSEVKKKLEELNRAVDLLIESETGKFANNPPSLPCGENGAPTQGGWDIPVNVRPLSVGEVYTILDIIRGGDE